MGSLSSLVAESHVVNRSLSSKQISKMVEPGLLSRQELLDNHIIYPELEQDKVVDTYRELRTKLLQISNGENRITMISGVAYKSGASHIALNLAAAFAFDESKTALVIDCNIRKPTLNQRLHLEPQFGLTDFLEQETLGLDRIIYASGIPRLRVIPVGQRREHSSEYFTSLRMKALLDVLIHRYPDRHIFLDAPPIGESADAPILTALADQVVIVIPYGKVQPAQIQSAVDAVDRHKLVGMVVNQ